MDLEEELKLRLNILRDIRSCFGFSFGATERQLEYFKLNNLIIKYENWLEEIQNYETKN